MFRMSVGSVAVALLLWGPLAGPAGPTALEAQVTGPGPDGRWPLQPNSPGNRTLAPFMEGWYANEDGTFSISFGYLNLNDDTLYIPVGENNFLEPAQFNGNAAHRLFSWTSPRALHHGTAGEHEGPGRLVDPSQSERRHHKSARPNQRDCLRIGLGGSASRQSPCPGLLRFATR